MAKKQQFSSTGGEFLTAAVQPSLGAGNMMLWLGWALLTASTVSAIFTLLQEKNLGAAVMAILILGGLLFALYRKIVRVRRSRLAVRLANALARTRTREIDRAEFDQVAGLPDATGSLVWLMEHAYLQNVAYDQPRQVIVCPDRRDAAPIILHRGFHCDSCGSSGALERSDKPVCPYCGSAVKLVRIRK